MTRLLRALVHGLWMARIVETLRATIDSIPGLKRGDARRRFSVMFALLILKANELGYEVAIDDVKSFPEFRKHSAKSFHYKAQAGDLNLYRDGVYLRKGSDHEPLGLYWESLGGTWGFRFKNKDGNHYSIQEIRK